NRCPSVQSDEAALVEFEPLQQPTKQPANIAERGEVGAEQEILERIEHRELEDFLLDVGERGAAGVGPGLPVRLALSDQGRKVVERRVGDALESLHGAVGAGELLVETL